MIDQVIAGNDFVDHERGKVVDVWSGHSYSLGQLRQFDPAMPCVGMLLCGLLARVRVEASGR